MNEVLKPKDVDAALIKRLEDQYGPMDMERDFFSDNLDTYFKTSTVDPETGSVGHKIIKLASFSESLQNLYTAFKSLRALSVTPEGKNDKKVVETLVKVREAFNGFRTYLRRYYPDQYESIKDRLDEMSTISSDSGFTSGGEGENHTGPSPRKSTYGAYTQAGFKKVTEGPGATLGFGPKAGPTGVTKNKYVTDFKYKLVKNPIKENKDVEQFLDDIQINEPSKRNFIKSRISAFDTIEDKLNQLIPMMQRAKNETFDYYRNNSDSYSIVYGTDLAQEYLNDLIELFKQ
jgi:hypothetical protein